MELKELLEKNPIINRSELARLMYPGVKSAPIIIQQKLKEAPVGNGKQRITDVDIEKAKEVLKGLRSGLDGFIEG